MSTSSQSRPGPLAHHRNLVLGLVVALWLAGTGIALWWFQAQVVRPFLAADSAPPNALQVEQGLQQLLDQIPAPTNTNTVTLLHFWNPECLCNQVSKRHFEGLIEAFDQQQLRIVAVAPAGTPEATLQQFRQLNGDRILLIKAASGFQPPVSPALALLRSDGALGYYGAYGFGALCSVANDDFFPNIVRRMSTGEYGPFVNVAGSGCFCPWPHD
ncbi:DUF6436 domain-containing protein [Oceanobacter mangrovi]|uniref:DUF6436 domain-containing protein n=1 Tax=Oceanobacter mangrovi TaxID=2862510 RepID=UPI001C8D4588|nr:DUF6436 domain-containing protein [Oceanobacter mangrovi]